MIKEELVQELNELFTAYLAKENIDFIELAYRRQGDKLVLTVLADKPQGDGAASDKPQGDGAASDSRSHSRSHKPQGGITLGECAMLNRKLLAILEEKNMIDVNYVLEVSSPGLDRPLKAKKDFLRCLNKEAEFFLNDLVGGKCQWQGLISKVDEQNVFIESKGQSLEIPLVKINKARLLI